MLTVFPRLSALVSGVVGSSTVADAAALADASPSSLTSVTSTSSPEESPPPPPPQQLPHRPPVVVSASESTLGGDLRPTGRNAEAWPARRGLPGLSRSGNDKDVPSLADDRGRPGKKRSMNAKFSISMLRNNLCADNISKNVP